MPYPENSQQPKQIYNEGSILFQNGQWQAAYDKFLLLLKITPKHAGLLSNIAICLENLGHPTEALKFAQRAVKAEAKNLTLLSKLAILQKRCGDDKKALATLKILISIKKTSPNSYVEICDCMYALGQNYHDISIVFCKGLNKFPKDISLLNLAGRYASNFGDLKKAELYCRKTISLAPFCGRAWYQLSRLIKTTSVDSDDVIKARATITSDPQLGNNLDRVELLYALGKMLDDCGQYKEAFERYKAANELHFELGVKSSPASVGKNILNIAQSNLSKQKATFNDNWIKQLENTKETNEHNPELRPIFIIGPPRSGTTLIEKILTSHSTIHGIGEAKVMGKLLTTAMQHDIRFPKDFAQLNSNQQKVLYTEIFKAFNFGQREPKLRACEKSLNNYEFAGAITQLFPTSKLVHIIRHPLDVGLSIYFRAFSSSTEHSFHLENIGSLYNSYFDWMEYWNELMPGRIHAIPYESLATNTHTQIKALLKFCELDWEESCLEFHKTQSLVATESMIQVRQPIYQNAIARWQHYEEQLEPLKQALSDKVKKRFGV